VSTCALLIILQMVVYVYHCIRANLSEREREREREREIPEGNLWLLLLASLERWEMMKRYFLQTNIHCLAYCYFGLSPCTY